MNGQQTAIGIRRLEEKDNTGIAAIIRAVLTEFNAAKPGTVYYDPTTDDLYNLFKEDRSVYFVAEADGELLGGCGIYPTAGLPDGCCELVKLYLLPEARGLHLGRQLIEKSILVAKEFGYTSMYLESLPELSKAVSLYEKLGFTYLPSSLGDSTHFGCSLWMIKDLA